MMEAARLEEKISQLDPDSARIVRALLTAPPTASLTPSEAREQRAAARLAAPRELEDVAEARELALDLPGRTIGARLYRPAGTAGAVPALVAYHGGGMVLGTLDDYEPLCRQLANRLGAVVVSVDYRLAPEHRFPAFVDDAYDAWQWVVEHADRLGIDDRRVGVSGDSAGGNLAAVVCLRARDEEVAPPVVQLLVYPLVQWGRTAADFDEELAVPPLTIESMLWFAEHSFDDLDEIEDWSASPLLAPSLAGLPPAVVVTAEFDVLRPTIERYVERLVDAGVPVEVLAATGVVHGFFSQAPLIATSTRVVEEAVAAVRPHLWATAAARS